MSISVRVSSTLEGGDEPLGLGHAKNISTSGMYVELQLTTPNRPLQLGEMVSLKFHPPTSDKVIVTRGMIARLEHRGGEASGIGVEFRDLSLGDRQAVERYVLAKLAEMP